MTAPETRFIIPHGKIRRATEINDCNEALRLGLKAIPATSKDRRELIQIELEKITREHKRIGYMTRELMERRSTVYNHLMSEARAALSPKDYQTFYHCY